MAAERDTVDRLVAHHLAGRIGEAFDGRVSGVTKSGLFVSLPQFGADGFIPVSTLGFDYYHYDEAHQALTGEKTGLGYRLGDSVEVKLVGSDSAGRLNAFRDAERRAENAQGHTIVSQIRPCPPGEPQKARHKATSRPAVIRFYERQRTRQPRDPLSEAGEARCWNLAASTAHDTHQEAPRNTGQRHQARPAGALPELWRRQAVPRPTSSRSTPAPPVARKCCITAPTISRLSGDLHRRAHRCGRFHGNRHLACS
jgi:predicted RNA-binding protein with RPS1 domain